MWFQVECLLRTTKWHTQQLHYPRQLYSLCITNLPLSMLLNSQQLKCSFLVTHFRYVTSFVLLLLAAKLLILDWGSTQLWCLQGSSALLIPLLTHSLCIWLTLPLLLFLPWCVGCFHAAPHTQNSISFCAFRILTILPQTKLALVILFVCYCPCPLVLSL